MPFERIFCTSSCDIFYSFSSASTNSSEKTIYMTILPMSVIWSGEEDSDLLCFLAVVWRVELPLFLALLGSLLKPLLETRKRSFVDKIRDLPRMQIAVARKVNSNSVNLVIWWSTIEPTNPVEDIVP